jgi:hypothetical protein
VKLSLIMDKIPLLMDYQKNLLLSAFHIFISIAPDNFNTLLVCP